MADIEKLIGSESRLEVGQKINEIIDNSANKDLSNLSETGEARFSEISSAISTNATNISSLNTTVNGKLSATVKKASNGYIKFNNGIIIQWGRTASFAGELTITLPTPFTTTNYTVVAGMYIKGDWTANWGTYSYTTTNFVVQNQSSGNKTMNWIAIGY